MNSLSQLATQKFWLKKLPCLEFAKNYSWEHLLGDFIAGITTALTVIPQGIGYAPLAGLPLQVQHDYHLYSWNHTGAIHLDCLSPPGSTKQCQLALPSRS